MTIHILTTLAFIVYGLSAFAPVIVPVVKWMLT